MSLRLNKIDDEIVGKNVVENRRILESFIAADSSSPLRSNHLRYLRRMAATALGLGLGLYQQEAEITEIRFCMAIAGNQLCNILLLDDEKAVLSPLEYEKATALATCFCTEDVFAEASAAGLDKFFEESPALDFYASLARYLDVLRGFLRSGKLDKAEWEKVVSVCSQNNAARFDAVVTLAKLNALVAVASGDEDTLNKSIAILIDDHENEAKRGEIQRSPQGFICLPALMFAQLGADHNLSCEIASPYLPLKLLDRHHG